MVQITAQAGPTGSGEQYTLGMSPAPPITSRWTDDLLDRMRETVDPLADQVISELMASGNLAAVNAVMRTLVENDQLPPKTSSSIRTRKRLMSPMVTMASPACTVSPVRKWRRNTIPEMGARMVVLSRSDRASARRARAD